MDNPSNDDDSLNKKDLDEYIIRIRGIPWSASKDDIIAFFKDCTIKNNARGIHLTMSREGRPSGEAFIELCSEDDVTKALTKDSETMDSRYIEVFKSSSSEMKFSLKRCGLESGEAFGDACVRLRGLPYECEEEDIAEFFAGLEIVKNGITLPLDHRERSTGEAFVQFTSQEMAEKAMERHKKKIGHRYIEIFVSSLKELNAKTGVGPMRMERSNRMTPYNRMDRPSMYGGHFGGRRDRGGYEYGFRDDYGMDRFPAREHPASMRSGFVRGYEHRVRMRGLPFHSFEKDICEFFAPVTPLDINVIINYRGRPSGEADVYFIDHDDALNAMRKDRKQIHNRYIELFLYSEPEIPSRSEIDFNDMGGFVDDNFADDRFGPRGGPPNTFMSEKKSFNYYPMGRNGSYSDGINHQYDRRPNINSNKNTFGFSNANRPGFGRSFPKNSGDRFGKSGLNMAQTQGMGMGLSDNDNREFDDNYGMGGGDFRSSRPNDAVKSEYGGKDNSEFYGSGKLFGDDNFPQSQGTGSNYTSF